MIPKYAHSLGGKKTALIFRKKALDEYIKNPTICKNCGNIIEVRDKEKVSTVRNRLFCGQSCAASFNNKERKKDKIIKIVKRENFKYLTDKTKEELFSERESWQSARTAIRRHAQFIYDKEIGKKFCHNCGYDKHIETCHIKSVSSFSNDTLISTINDSKNLIGLCPNCHWEFDNNNLKIL